MKKMMTLLAFSTLLTGLSLAQGAPAPQPHFAIEGDWGMQMEQNGFQLDMTFSIRNNAITLVNVCTLGGNSSTARASSPANYDDRSITVLANAQDDENQNGVDCNVSLRPDRMNYEVRGNQLIFTHDGSAEQLVLTKK
jgi:hypothetical protein